MSTEDVLFRLSETLASRRNADPEKSYTAKLFARGPDSILKKIGEEGAELIMAAKDGERAHIIYEAADLMYHLVALLTFYGIGAGEVLDELRRREGRSGIDEKNSRGKAEQETSVENCLFCKIVRGEIPSRQVYEDDQVIAFHDIHPARPMHLLVIPKRHIDSLQTVTSADEPILGRLLAVAQQLARENGSPEGFRVIINNGRIGGQEVPHLHAHIVGGPEPVGPMLARNQGSSR